MESRAPVSPKVVCVPTLTHARLRAEQGDVEGARQIAREVLRERPGDAEALRLIDSLDGRRQRLPAEEVADELGAAREERSAQDLSETFRREFAQGGGVPRPAVARLEGWLDRIQKQRARAAR